MVSNYYVSSAITSFYTSFYWFLCPYGIRKLKLWGLSAVLRKWWMVFLSTFTVLWGGNLDGDFWLAHYLHPNLVVTQPLRRTWYFYGHSQFCEEKAAMAIFDWHSLHPPTEKINGRKHLMSPTHHLLSSRWLSKVDYLLVDYLVLDLCNIIHMKQTAILQTLWLKPWGWRPRHHCPSINNRFSLSLTWYSVEMD